MARAGNFQRVIVPRRDSIEMRAVLIAQCRVIGCVVDIHDQIIPCCRHRRRVPSLASMPERGAMCEDYRTNNRIDGSLAVERSDERR